MHMKQTKKKQKSLFVPLSVSSIRFLFNLFYSSKLKFPLQSAEMVAKNKQYNIEGSWGFLKLPFKLAVFLRKIEIFGYFQEPLNCQNITTPKKHESVKMFWLFSDIKKNCKFRRIICSCETPTRIYSHIYAIYC